MASCAGKGLEKMCLWKNKRICSLLSCFVLNNYKPEIVPHPTYMFLQAFTGSIPSNSKFCWSWTVTEVETRLESLFLTMGKPDDNAGSLRWGDGVHMDITPAECIPQHWRIPLNYEKGRIHSSCLTVQINWAVTMTSTYFQPFQPFYMLHQDMMLPPSPHRLYFPPPVLFTNVARNFSENRSSLINGSFHPSCNLKRSLTVAFCAQSLNKEIGLVLKIFFAGRFMHVKILQFNDYLWSELSV